MKPAPLDWEKIYLPEITKECVTYLQSRFDVPFSVGLSVLLSMIAFLCQSKFKIKVFEKNFTWREVALNLFSVTFHNDKPGVNTLLTEAIKLLDDIINRSRDSNLNYCINDITADELKGFNNSFYKFLTLFDFNSNILISLSKEKKLSNLVVDGYCADFKFAHNKLKKISQFPHYISFFSFPLNNNSYITHLFNNERLYHRTLVFPGSFDSQKGIYNEEYWSETRKILINNLMQIGCALPYNSPKLIEPSPDALEYYINYFDRYKEIITSYEKYPAGMFIHHNLMKIAALLFVFEKNREWDFLPKIPVEYIKSALEIIAGCFHELNYKKFINELKNKVSPSEYNKVKQIFLYDKIDSSMPFNARKIVQKTHIKTYKVKLILRKLVSEKILTTYKEEKNYVFPIKAGRPKDIQYIVTQQWLTIRSYIKRNLKS